MEGGKEVKIIYESKYSMWQPVCLTEYNNRIRHILENVRHSGRHEQNTSRDYDAIATNGGRFLGSIDQRAESTS